MPAKKPARLRVTRRRRARSSAVEHLTFNQVVVGSIPTGLTKIFRDLAVSRNCSQERLPPGYWARSRRVLVLVAILAAIPLVAFKLWSASEYVGDQMLGRQQLQELSQEDRKDHRSSSRNARCSPDSGGNPRHR